MAAPDGATCPAHVDALAVDVCQRCGRFVCATCLVLRKELSLCAACAQRPHGVSKRAGVALVASALGFVSCGLGVVAPLASVLALTGPAVGVMLGVIEQRAIADGRASPDGRTVARWAVRLGVFQLVVVAVLSAAFVAWRVTRAP